jgi:UDP-GlcNAc3NAcA epimerase
MLRIVTVVGARPQFIKASAVSRAIGEWNRGGGGELAEFIIHTGQHYDADMSEVFFSELELPKPAANLNVGSGSHATQTGAMLLGLEKLFTEIKPDVILVYGDTNSTLAAAIVAAKMGIPLAHVEAGLRSGNRSMPEEINRIAADRLSTVLFTATKAAVDHLVSEGLSDRVHVVGDVMLDCVRIYGNESRRTADILIRLGLRDRKYLLATIHRAENTNDTTKLVEIFTGLSRAAESLPVVLPIHPRTASVVRRHVPESALDKIAIIEPAGFLDMMTLEAGARVIATDSGGVQKEAYFHGIPCVTIREETEWVETVESGWNVLSPANAGSILANIQKMLGFNRGIPRPAFYGDGHAADKIVACLANRSCQ